MKEGERVREIRKKNGLTLEKFAERIGVRKPTISRIENGVNGLTDQMCKSICREYHVNEHWLRTGEGEMSAKDLSDTNNINVSKLEDMLMNEYLKLTESDRCVFREHLKKVISEIDSDLTDANSDISTD